MPIYSENCVAKGFYLLYNLIKLNIYERLD